MGKIKIKEKAIRSVLVTMYIPEDMKEDIVSIGRGKFVPGLRNILESYKQEIKQTAKELREKEAKEARRAS